MSSASASGPAALASGSGEQPDGALETLARELERLERVTAQWPTEQRAAVEAIRTTIEQLQREAFVRLVRALRADPAAMPALRRSIEDEWVRAVLTYHGILRAPPPAATDQAPLAQRLSEALVRIRPTLAAHGGDLELVQLAPPAVTLRWNGTCDGCAFAGTTSRELVEVEIRKACPELTTIELVTGGRGASDAGLIALGTRPRAHDACGLDEIPEQGALFRTVGGVGLLLTRAGAEIRVYPNACPHLGMPLDDGEIADGVLTCRYHGFAYLLSTGECLTVPEIALARLPVQLEGQRVMVDLGRLRRKGAA